MKQLISATVLATAALLVSSAASADTVKVGIIAPMSGAFAVNGKIWEASAKAFQKIYGTTAGGHTVKLVWKDLSEVNRSEERRVGKEC